MTDQEVVDIIRRRLQGVAVELDLPTAATGAQWLAAMEEVAIEKSREFSWLKPAPILLAAPEVSGTGTVGEILTTSDGEWEGVPTSYTYKWQRDGVPISGAGTTAKTYTLVTADGGTAVGCIVTAHNEIGDTAAPETATVGVEAVGVRAARHAHGARAKT